MEAICHRCHQSFPADSAFCPHCGAAQLYVTAEQMEDEAAAGNLPPLQRVSRIDWHRALLSSLVVAAAAAVLSALAVHSNNSSSSPCCVRPKATPVRCSQSSACAPSSLPLSWRWWAASRAWHGRAAAGSPADIYLLRIYLFLM
ncbi:hypothetical protein AB4043_08555 [Terriglobus sp. YAF25]|uniref:hypothetical protein n=1 Tax=Terriglobus sp. YAF25 TaxID=3233080 RepID=UPI003F9B5F93